MGPGRRIVAGPSCGLRSLWDPLGCSVAPGLFLGRHFIDMGSHRALVALRRLFLTAALPEGRGGYTCRRRA